MKTIEEINQFNVKKILAEKKIPSVTFTTNNNIALSDDSDISYLYDDRIDELHQAYQETNEHLEQ